MSEQLFQLKQNKPKRKQNCFVSVLFQRFVHVKQNAETKQKCFVSHVWNKTFWICFGIVLHCFVSDVRAALVVTQFCENSTITYLKINNSLLQKLLIPGHICCSCLKIWQGSGIFWTTVYFSNFFSVTYVVIVYLWLCLSITSQSCTKTM